MAGGAEPGCGGRAELTVAPGLCGGSRWASAGAGAPGGCGRPAGVGRPGGRGSPGLAWEVRGGRGSPGWVRGGRAGSGGPGGRGSALQRALHASLPRRGVAPRAVGSAACLSAQEEGDSAPQRRGRGRAWRGAAARAERGDAERLFLYSAGVRAELPDLEGAVVALRRWRGGCLRDNIGVAKRETERLDRYLELSNFALATPELTSLLGGVS